MSLTHSKIGPCVPTAAPRGQFLYDTLEMAASIRSCLANLNFLLQFVSKISGVPKVEA